MPIHWCSFNIVVDERFYELFKELFLVKYNFHFPSLVRGQYQWTNINGSSSVRGSLIDIKKEIFK
jgi:hypothetical protein